MKVRFAGGPVLRDREKEEDFGRMAGLRKTIFPQSKFVFQNLP
jgi:hypothetical protein